MKKKKIIISLIICLLLLAFNLFGIYNSINNKINFKIESKTVWISSNVISRTSHSGTRYHRKSTTYFVRYDDHEGETGILYTDSSGNNLKIGDSVTVYRNAAKSPHNDSTHDWRLTEVTVERNATSSIIIFVIFTVINLIVLYGILRKMNRIK